MEQAEIEDARRRIQQEARELFPEGAIREAALLQYGDDPSVEPGQLVVRLLLPSAEGAEGAEPDRSQMDTFHTAHRVAMQRFRDYVAQNVPQVRFIEVTDDSGPAHMARMRLLVASAPPERGGDLTPVMARLGTTDLETLDTLITTGIAANRADAVRWALARIRERPAYAELRERARQIEELKAQF
jgi:hypothetical protein